MTHGLEGPAGWALVAAALLGCAAGLLAGLRSGPLWLDEALSVEIARLPLTQLPDGLRQDGAPPLYYVLLKAWMALFGDGTTAVRLLSVVLVPVALLLVHRLGGQLAGRAGARAGVVVLASLPWTMRYGTETRMYALVVVLVLAGALALRAVHAGGSRWSVVGLAACVAALLLTHYWALFLLAAVGLLHVPALVRRRPGAVRAAGAGLLGALVFLPWVPTLVFQAVHTGAPWADPVTVSDLLRTPELWSVGRGRLAEALAVLLVGLAVVAVARLPATRRPAAVVVLTLLLAWGSVRLGGGAYTGRYTAVVVPVVALLVALGAVSLGGVFLGAVRLGGRWAPVVALTAVAALGVAAGVPAAGAQRSSTAGLVTALRGAAEPGDLVAYCPDQLGPPIARELGPVYEQVVYPTLGPPQRIDWVDYRARQRAADPARVARLVDDRAADGALFVLAAREYRTFEGHCEALLAALETRRGPPEHLFGELGSTGQLLFRFPPR